MNLKGERCGDAVVIEGDGVLYERVDDNAHFKFTGKVDSCREIRSLIKRLDRLMVADCE